MVDPGIGQAGSLVDFDRLRFDFHCPRAVNPAELRRPSRIANCSPWLAFSSRRGMLRVSIAWELRAMASSFSIQARQHWTFQLVLLGSRLCLEGRCEGPEPLQCSTWLQPQDAPFDVAHELIAHPSCCV